MAARKKTSKKTTDITPSDVDKQIEDIDFAVSVGTETTVTKSVKGIEISLNTKAETFFGVGDIWLSSKDYTCKVPDNVSPATEIAIRNAIKRGVLVEGNVKINPIEKNNAVLDEYWDLIKTFGLENSVTNPSESLKRFRKLFKEGVDRNWTAKEIARFCYRKEQDYKNRDKVLKLLKDTIQFSTCPDTLLET